MARPVWPVPLARSVCVALVVPLDPEERSDPRVTMATPVLKVASETRANGETLVRVALLDLPVMPAIAVLTALLENKGESGPSSGYCMR